MKLKLLKFVAAACAGALFIVPIQAKAATLNLSDSISTYILTNNNTSQAQVGVPSPVNQTLAGGGMSATGTTSLGPPPSVSVAASVTQAGQQATAQAYMEYFFGVAGPSNVQVPIIITANGSVTVAQASSNSAQLSFGTPSGVSVVASACQSINPGNCSTLSNSPTFNLSLHTTITANSMNNIQMTVFAVANTNVGGTNDSGSAFIDPIITIDPSFTLQGYTLEFSEGIQNAAATVPLPAALPLFATGLGALALLGWRRKRKQTATA